MNMAITMRQTLQIQDIMTSPKQLPLKWANLEKALHKQCGKPVMDTTMWIIKKIAIIL
jgi:hypothetical protein